jgi:hypothetical protein
MAPLTSQAGSFAEGLVRDIEAVDARLQAWCQRERDSLDWSATAAPPDDGRGLRIACAATLDDRPWPFRDPWVFHGQFDDGPADGDITTLGFRREIDMAGGRFLVVVGRSWRTQYPGTDRERTSTLPIADLYLQRDGQWGLAWHFLTTAGDYHRPSPPLTTDDPQVDALEAVNKGWTLLQLEYRDHARTFLDARGTEFSR